MAARASKRRHPPRYFVPALNEAMFRIPLLDAEEEVRLARRGRDPSASKPERQEARDRLVLANLRLAVSIARGYARKNPGHAQDLYQEAHAGRARAARDYDPDAHDGARFSTYAAHWIREGIRGYFANRAAMIRIPVYLQDAIRKVERGKAPARASKELPKMIAAARAASGVSAFPDEFDLPGPEPDPAGGGEVEPDEARRALGRLAGG